MQGSNVSGRLGDTIEPMQRRRRSREERVPEIVSEVYIHPVEHLRFLINPYVGRLKSIIPSNTKSLARSREENTSKRHQPARPDVEQAPICSWHAIWAENGPSCHSGPAESVVEYRPANACTNGKMHQTRTRLRASSATPDPLVRDLPSIR